MADLLIADDHPIFLSGLKSFLEAHGHTVIATANSAAETVMTLRTLRPDVLMVDVHMTGGGGLEVLKHVREIKLDVPTDAAGYRIVDIREPMECEFEPLPVAGHLALPLGRLLDGGLRVDPTGRYLLVCAHGVRSRAAAELLRSRGHPNVWSLRGGLAGDRG